MPKPVTPFYQEPGVLIFNADALELIDTLSEASAIITDPPYGIAFDFTKDLQKPRGTLNWGAHYQIQHHRIWANVVGDDQPFDPKPYLRFEQAILWGANHYADKLPPAARWLVWDKKHGMTSDDHGDCELAWTNLPGAIRRFDHCWRGVVRAGKENVANGPKLHPCQKPEALIRWCIAMTTWPIIDPYMGSGTTVLAAKALGRPVIGIEIDERYCEVAVKRLRQQVLPFADDSTAAAANGHESIQDTLVFDA